MHPEAHQFAHASKTVALGGGQRGAVAHARQMRIDALKRRCSSKKAHGRIDRERIAQRLKPRYRQNWGATTFDHVDHQRSIDLLADAGHLILGLGAFDEDKVSACLGIELAASDRFGEAERGAGVGARDDQKVPALALGNSNFDLAPSPPLGSRVGPAYVHISWAAPGLRSIAAMPAAS